MKFLLRIMVYVVATLLNFGIYVFLFLSMTGLSPEQSIGVVKSKALQVAIDTVSVGNEGPELTDEMRQEISNARNIVSGETEDLRRQKDSLLTEKAELEVLRDEIQRLLTRKSKDEEDRMYNLAKIYDGMDQERVADVFSQMQDSLIVALLPKMKPNNASQVLEFMTPKRSAKISRMMLEGD
ncbi:MAG: hypothetical protein GY839_16400 [candidate division Zixibacteria bacterium]|nr:hypothetical protein [candidate division Zixibacteria bacterium]